MRLLWRFIRAYEPWAKRHEPYSYAIPYLTDGMFFFAWWPLFGLSTALVLTVLTEVWAALTGTFFFRKRRLRRP